MPFNQIFFPTEEQLKVHSTYLNKLEHILFFLMGRLDRNIIIDEEVLRLGLLTQINSIKSIYFSELEQRTIDSYRKGLSFIKWSTKEEKLEALHRQAKAINLSNDEIKRLEDIMNMEEPDVPFQI